MIAMINGEDENSEERVEVAATTEELRRAENRRRSFANLRPWRPGPVVTRDAIPSGL
jgi:hypothetical protein